MKQYDIRWADMAAPIGRRPVLLLQRSSAIAYLNKLIVVEITTTIRNIPQELRLGAREGFPQPSVINFDNVHVVAKTRLGDLIGTLATKRHVEAKRALGHALAWDELRML